MDNMGPKMDNMGPKFFLDNLSYVKIKIKDLNFPNANIRISSKISDQVKK